jgi:quercetin dioxygenase-like cupin family protein
MNPHASLIEFTAQAMEDGFDEVVQKEWAADLVIEKHAHAFDVRVQVNRGEVNLSLATGIQKIEAGHTFYLARNTEHAEHYGPEGATFWVARKL